MEIRAARRDPFYTPQIIDPADRPGRKAIIRTLEMVSKTNMWSKARKLKMETWDVPVVVKVKVTCF